jgi:accessory colonization factor AcfC
MSAMDKALTVLHGKMGIGGPQVSLEQARRLYVEKYKSALPQGAIQAMAALLRLNVPSISAVDNALIAMAGSGGPDLPPSGVLESVA